MSSEKTTRQSHYSRVDQSDTIEKRHLSKKNILTLPQLRIIYPPRAHLGWKSRMYRTLVGWNYLHLYYSHCYHENEKACA